MSLIKEYHSPPDHKHRWGSILEIPLISMVQRALIDSGRVTALARALHPYPYKNVLDVGCGLGENSVVVKTGSYRGLDNSFARVEFARKRFARHQFVAGDAMGLPFHDSTFDLLMLIDTSHHLSDEQFHRVLKEMLRVSTKYLVVSDPIIIKNQSRISSLFYSMDRGACFRTFPEMLKIIESAQGLKILDTVFYKTFPGLYHRAIIITEIVSCA